MIENTLEPILEPETCGEFCVSQCGFGSCVSILQLVNVARSISDAGLPVLGTLLSHMKMMCGVHKPDFALLCSCFSHYENGLRNNYSLCVTEMINSAV